MKRIRCKCGARPTNPEPGLVAYVCNKCHVKMRSPWSSYASDKYRKPSTSSNRIRDEIARIISIRKMPTVELCDELGIGRNKLYQHLRYMRDDGIIESEHGPMCNMWYLP